MEREFRCIVQLIPEFVEKYRQTIMDAFGEKEGPIILAYLFDTKKKAIKPVSASIHSIPEPMSTSVSASAPMLSAPLIDDVIENAEEQAAALESLSDKIVEKLKSRLLMTLVISKKTQFMMHCVYLDITAFAYESHEL